MYNSENYCNMQLFMLSSSTVAYPVFAVFVHGTYYSVREKWKLIYGRKQDVFYVLDQ